MSDADPKGPVRLASFMAEAGERPYRELVEHHVRRQTEKQLRESGVWEVSRLPVGMRALGSTFIDVVNERLAYDAEFWATASCRDAYKRIMGIAIEVFDHDALISSGDDPFWLDDQELAFGLFQIPTLTFAYSAISQRSMRKFRNIRKGLFR